MEIAQATAKSLIRVPVVLSQSNKEKLESAQPSEKSVTPVPDVLLRNYKIQMTSDAAGLEDILQGTFDVYKTNGNGACAIHSVFGVPNKFGEYKCEEARQLFYESLGDAYSDFTSKFEGNRALLDRWQRNVWLEMVRPCIDANFKEWNLPDNADREVKMFCKTVAKDRKICEDIMKLRRQSEDLRSDFNTAREDLARRFGACCRLSSAAWFVDPVLHKLGRYHEFHDEGKYHVLFQSGPEA